MYLFVKQILQSQRDLVIIQVRYPILVELYWMNLIREKRKLTFRGR